MLRFLSLSFFRGDLPRISAFAALVLTAWGASPLLADDIVPPNWPRLTPYTTVQEWDFNTPGVIQPDGNVLAPYFNENPTQDIPLVTPGAGVAWSDQGGVLGGVYIGNGAPDSFLDFYIPNWIDFRPFKEIHLQINGIWDETPIPFVSGITAFDNLTGPAVLSTFEDSAEVFPGFHRYEDWRLEPNPDNELIRVFVPNGTLVSQVVVDTYSVPEPSTLAIAGMALFMLGGYTWRANRRERHAAS